VWEVFVLENVGQFYVVAEIEMGNIVLDGKRINKFYTT
jgi:hypothetical protein